MSHLPTGLENHRVSTSDLDSVCVGQVRYAPRKSAWFLGMAGAAVIGGTATFTWSAFALFLGVTGCVLLLGHSLGSHRKLIHDSYQCPKWLEYVLVYLGGQVGLAGPIGLLRQHELRDFAQRLPECHDYLRHGSSFWRDAWWQLNCELRLRNPPSILIEPRLAENRFYGWLEKTWMAQQIPWAVLFYALGGWGFIFWGVCARVTAGVLGHWLIGYFAHNRGAMHYEVGNAAVQGHNIPLTSVLTMGECWHNNHHAFPGSARLGLFPGEWDPGWWMLLLFHRLGLTWNFRLPEHLPMRAELHCLDKRAAAHFQEARFSRAGSAPQNPGLRQIWHRLRSQPTAKDLGDAAMDLRIEWPAALLSLPRMRCLVGRQIDLRVNFALDRLVLYEGATPTLGLPGLCIAMARRNEAARTVALCLLPFAAAMETARSSLAVR